MGKSCTFNGKVQLENHEILPKLRKFGNPKSQKGKSEAVGRISPSDFLTCRVSINTGNSKTRKIKS